MQYQCQICFNNNPIVYSLADCKHYFCIDCCLEHVTTKSQLFTDILCPDVDCKKPFNRRLDIMNRLSRKVVENIEKRDNFVYLSTHPQIKQCTVPNCTGVYNTKDTKRLCSKCQTAYCPKCSKPFHQGPCLLNVQDQQMKQLNYQKCPQCSVWVEKKQGCNYVDCKCGLSFCYICGVSFKDDPCRLKQLWAEQIQIRKMFLQIKNVLSSYRQKCLSNIFKLILKCILIILMTIFLSLLANILMILVIGLSLILSPIVILGLGCASQHTYVKVLVIVFLPFIAFVFDLLFVLMILLYPCLRKTAHHGIYDGFDIAISKASSLYLIAILHIL